MKFNLGCGRQAEPGFVNVDRRPLDGVDVVLDIDGPWPWGENSVDAIRAWHILEHVEDLPAFMDKAWRVLRPGGVLNVRVPHHRHRNADTDPTHIRRFTEHSFDYWFPGTAFEGFSALQWHPAKATVKGGRRLPVVWRHPALRYVYVLPPHELEWHLTPIKRGGGRR